MDFCSKLLLFCQNSFFFWATNLRMKGKWLRSNLNYVFIQLFHVTWSSKNKTKQMESNTKEWFFDMSLENAKSKISWDYFQIFFNSLVTFFCHFLVILYCDLLTSTQNVIFACYTILIKIFLCSLAAYLTSSCWQEKKPKKAENISNKIQDTVINNNLTNDS